MKDENLFKGIAVAFLGGLVFGFTFGIIIGVLLPSASPGEPTNFAHLLGSWGLPCKSHYYIPDNKIEWL